MSEPQHRPVQGLRSSQCSTARNQAQAVPRTNQLLAKGAALRFLCLLSATKMVPQRWSSENQVPDLGVSKGIGWQIWAAVLSTSLHIHMQPTTSSRVHTCLTMGQHNTQITPGTQVPAGHPEG